MSVSNHFQKPKQFDFGGKIRVTQQLLQKPGFRVITATQ